LGRVLTSLASRHLLFVFSVILLLLAFYPSPPTSP